MKFLFLDESGDHDLINIDKKYPTFVLAGCIFNAESYKVLAKRLNDFKEKLFADKNLILHYSDYTRNRSGFEKIKNRSFREDFFYNLNKLILNSNCELLACIVDKNKHNEKYGYNANNPYLLSLNFIIERFVFYLKSIKEKGKIIAESRNPQLDNELELAYLNLKIDGTRYLTPKEIKDYLEDFTIKKKEENVSGLQLIDSMVTIGRKYLKLRNYYINYEIIKSKFRKNKCGKYKGYGLIIFP